MRIRFPALAALAAGLLVGGAARAQMSEMPPGKWWKRPPVVQALGLTPEQQEKLDQIFARNRRDFVDLKADVEKKQLDLEELMVKKDSDPKKVASAIDAVEQSRARLRKATAMMILDMRGVLTDAQWKQVVERREQWRSERRDEMRESLRGGAGPRRPGAGGPPPQPPAPRPSDVPNE